MSKVTLLDLPRRGRKASVLGSLAVAEWFIFQRTLRPLARTRREES